MTSSLSNNTSSSSATAAGPRNNNNSMQRLASLSIQQTFGTSVQLVSDALQSRGEQTLSQLVSYLKKRTSGLAGSGGGSLKHPSASSNNKTPRRLGVVLGRRPCPTDRASVRAALLVLLQHDIVKVRVVKHQHIAPPPPTTTTTTAGETEVQQPPVLIYYYSFQPQHARRLLRYAKYVEFVKKVVWLNDDVVAHVLQVLLVAGRLSTIEWLKQCVQQLQLQQEQTSSSGNPKFTMRQQVVDAAYKLITTGFVITTPPLFTDKNDEDEDSDEGEFEFEGGDTNKELPTKRLKTQDNGTSNDADDKDDLASDHDEQHNDDPALRSIIQSSAHYKHALPLVQVWNVNCVMLDHYQRAYQLGRMIAERYGHKIQSCGSIITAALKFVAQQQYNPHEYHNTNNGTVVGMSTFAFTPNGIVKYLPKPVLHLLDKKVGGVQRSLPKVFEELVNLAEHPVVLRPIIASTTSGGEASTAVPRYEIRVDALVRYLQERVQHQMIHDRHGVVAARVVSVLLKFGYLESETLAEHAMVPVKDVREVLHQLYKSRYVDLLQLSTSSSSSSRSYGGVATGGGLLSAGNASSSTHGGGGSGGGAIYLWGISSQKLHRTITEHVALALCNIRLRRQHELEIGKQWIQRAQQASEMDENDHERDKLNYTKFCLGLERLDVAALQLDDTLLVLNGFR